LGLLAASFGDWQLQGRIGKECREGGGKPCTDRHHGIILNNIADDLVQLLAHGAHHIQAFWQRWLAVPGAGGVDWRSDAS